MSNDDKLTVFYNSACPVCDAGICYQRSLMEHQNIIWIDVHRSPEQLEKLGLNLEQVREQLHVQDSDGKLLIGDLALASLWKRTPKQWVFANIVHYGHFITKPLYRLFARCLYCWNRKCDRW
jgi:predicted DCC family thiol-disulfide oxidoreductase YuxK